MFMDRDDILNLFVVTNLPLPKGALPPSPSAWDLDDDVAAMEVLARDLKALGLYAARSLSFDGVEYEMVEHALTEEQTRIYNAYAGAFQVIHSNLDEALGITNGNLNSQTKSAARSAFESAKQRFFNHLITAMQTQTLITKVDADLAAGHAAVIQIVSTGEALMERRLADIPTEDWDDTRIRSESSQ
jgi:hypothetical protein